jgi:hypothetical protein
MYRHTHKAILSLTQTHLMQRSVFLLVGSLFSIGQENDFMLLAGLSRRKERLNERQQLSYLSEDRLPLR